MAQYIAEVTEVDRYTLSYKFKDSVEVYVVTTLTLLDLVKSNFVGKECQLEMEWREGVNTLLNIELFDWETHNKQQLQLVDAEFSRRNGT